MKITFTEAAWSDYLWFQDTDKKLLKRINTLIKEILRTPFEGMGKPEPLKANLSGYWSRRINTEHRLVYEVLEENIIIVACRFHYQD
jgi:toxin YoeB